MNAEDRKKIMDVMKKVIDAGDGLGTLDIDFRTSVELAQVFNTANRIYRRMEGGIE